MGELINFNVDFERQVQRSESLSALRRYFSSPIASSDKSLNLGAEGAAGDTLEESKVTSEELKLVLESGLAVGWTNSTEGGAASTSERLSLVEDPDSELEEDEDSEEDKDEDEDEDEDKEEEPESDKDDEDLDDEDLSLNFDNLEDKAGG